MVSRSAPGVPDELLGAAIVDFDDVEMFTHVVHRRVPCQRVLRRPRRSGSRSADGRATASGPWARVALQGGRLLWRLTAIKHRKVNRVLGVLGEVRERGVAQLMEGSPGVLLE